MDCEQTHLRTAILTENEKAHDYYAPFHDGVCAYIARERPRKRYESMITTLTHFASRPKSRLRVLEIGCGTGTWAHLFEGCAKYVGVDISQGMIDLAKQKYESQGFEFYCDDVRRFLERSDEMEYDIILSSSFLHHLYDVDEIVSLLARKMAPGAVYLALHEPYIYRDRLRVQQPLGRSLDEILAYLLGYDIDIRNHPWPKRILNTIKRLVPFKKHLKRIFRRQAFSSPSINLVDYRLSDGVTFHPSMFLNRSYAGLSIDFDLYSYSVIPEVSDRFAVDLNYFYVRFLKQPG